MLPSKFFDYIAKRSINDLERERETLGAISNTVLLLVFKGDILLFNKSQMMMLERARKF